MNVTTTITTATTMTSTICVQQPSSELQITVIGTLAGAILGAFLTYCISRKITLFSLRNQRLYEGVYRPLLGQIGVIRDEIQEGENPDLTAIKKTRRDGLFRLLDEKERDIAEKVYRRMREYENAYQAADHRGRNIIKDEMKTRFLGNNTYANLVKYLTTNELPTYKLIVGERSTTHIILLTSLILERDPYDVLRDRATITTDRSFECIISSDAIPRELAKDIAESALAAAKGNGSFKWLWSVRDEVVKGIDSLIKMLEKHV